MTHVRLTYEFGSYNLELPEHVLRRGIEIINLPSRQLEVLALIVLAAPEPVAKQMFFEVVWRGAFVEEANLTQTIFLLRRTLGRCPKGGGYIETLPRRGYRLATEVILRREEETPPKAEAPVTIALDQAPLPELTPAQQAPTSIPLPESPTNADTARYAPRTRGYGLPHLVLAQVLALLLALVLFSVWHKAFSRHPVLLAVHRLTNDGGYKEFAAPLLFDGSRLFFTEIVGNRNVLAQVPAAGGLVTRSPVPNDGDSAIGLARVSGRILFNALWSGGAAHVLNATDITSGATLRFANTHASYAALSPDGRSLVWTEGHKLMLAAVDGGQPRELASFPDVPFWPAWSPDGRRIRFSRNTGGLDQSIWELDSRDSTRPHPIFGAGAHSHTSCCGSWSKDGRYFVYVVDSLHASSVWVHPETGGHDLEIAAGPMDYWRAPLIDDDGRHVFAIGEQARGELVRFAPRSKSWVPAYGGISADTVAVSRDGTWIAYTLFPEGTLWRSRADGSDKVQLTFLGEVARFPQWAPDGRSIAYSSAVEGGRWQVKLISREGGAPRAVLADGTSQGAPTFSSDGSRVAFGRIPALGISLLPAMGISVVDLRTGEATKIPQSDNLWMARWSPRGDQLVAATLNRNQLMLYDFRTDAWNELLSFGVNDIAWTHDGSRIIFDARNGTDGGVFSVDVTTRAVSLLAPLNDVERTGFSGWRLSVTPRDEVVLLRQRGFVEVYALDVSLP